MTSAVVIVILVIWFFGKVLNDGQRARAAQTAPKPMVALALRATERFVNDDPASEKYLDLEVQGLIPTDRPRSLAFVASVLDATDNDNWQPVVSSLNWMQEPDSLCFQNRTSIGECTPNQGFSRWVRAAVVPLQHLQPPRSGNRRYALIVRLVDEKAVPPIRNGFCAEAPGVLWTRVLFADRDVRERGYEEEAEARDEARALSVQLAVAVALVDGCIADAEGESIKRWMARVVTTAGAGAYQDALKDRLNAAMKEAFARGTTGALAISDLTSRLRDVGLAIHKLACVELCFDVATSGGLSSARELAFARQIAIAVGVDSAELERIQDLRLVSVGSSIDEGADVSALLGIDPRWDAAKVKAHLRAEFQKWNNRLGTLADSNERANAQRMLDMISRARTKYV